MQTAAFCFITAAAACYVFGFPVYSQLLKWNVIDRPNERSSHVRATVRGGGIGIVVAVIFGSLLLLTRGTQSEMLTVLAPFALLIAGISFVDDLRSLPARVRFGSHAVAAFAALYGLELWTMSVSSPWPFTLAFPVALTLVIVVGFLWVVGYTNAFNFMDGINGIATLQAIVTAVGSALVAYAAGANWTDLPLLFACIVAGAAAGFLPHNFPRARMFMGDVSSAPLGYLLAALLLWICAEYGWWLIIPLGLLHANFVLDTGFTLIRRIWRGEKWYSAHREHFYQRLVRSGKSHTFVTGWEMALQVVVVAAMAGYVFADTGIRLALVAVVFALWAAFFCYCELRFRRTATVIPPNPALAAQMQPGSANRDPENAEKALAE